ncbi:MAG: DoxX family membrane protein [Candidatus Margulisbacteria bacterium]|nr:DoxX family membrane protein [Candidatus Margulisiibacteriota bacterium]
MNQKFHFVARVLLGLVFLVFGLNGFFNFLPISPMPERAASFEIALMQSGYFLPMLKSIEVLSGALLVLGLYAPLCIVMLFPIVINIFLFHFFMAPEGLPMAIGILVVELYLIYSYREAFKGILEAKSDR